MLYFDKNVLLIIFQNSVIDKLKNNNTKIDLEPF